MTDEAMSAACRALGEGLDSAASAIRSLRLGVNGSKEMSDGHTLRWCRPSDDEKGRSLVVHNADLDTKVLVQTTRIELQLEAVTALPALVENMRSRHAVRTEIIQQGADAALDFAATLLDQEEKQ